MVAGSVTNEIVSPVAPARLWKAFRDGYNLLPKVLPDLISSVNILQGDGASVGSIIQINFTSANKNFSYVKDRVDEVDDQKFVYKYTTIGGGYLGTKLSAGTSEVKFEGSAEGGTKSTFTSNFDTISDSPPSEADIQEAKAAGDAAFKAVEAYLLANPDSYA